ncbi:MAG: electron transfer flavoprotein subunit alpha [Candidatus Ratteibacteria bacterium]|jgi:electron transfer flavoprotein alpha subunit
MEIRVITEKCTGCRICYDKCAFGAIEMENEKARITENCTFCTVCVKVCPEQAIEIKGERKKEPKKAVSSSGVWFFAETRRGKLASVSYELLSAALNLAKELNEETSAVLFAADGETMAYDLIARGCEKVYLVEDPSLNDFHQDTYVCLLSNLILSHRPNIFIASATMAGRSFVPQVAARIRTGLTADCTDLRIDPKTKLLHQIRPTYGGNLMAMIMCEHHRPQMATVRPKVMDEAKPIQNPKGEIIREDFASFAPFCRVELLSQTMAEQTVDLQEAEIIVSGGRGIGEGKNFEMIRTLAGLLGGTVGASRAAVDSGWIPYPHQVGQTGTTVKPKIYIACGISGAIQHLAGMQTSDYIIAINKDPEAPIFKVANLGIVGDLFEVLPLLIRKLEQKTK